MRTPFGGALGEVCFADIAPDERLTEMDFEMGLAGVDAGVTASDVGRVLESVLPKDDALGGYAQKLQDPSFDIPLAGLINGSIDAVLRVRQPDAPRPRLVIADYKTNRLHTAEMSHPAEAYAPHRLAAAMADHDYPLQAVVYGTAVYRMLRWRLREEDPSDCLAGIVYAFVRGTRGPDGPADAAGRRHGMFVWQPPRALWARLSRLFAGDRP
jgi:exodeoxyribonuclease V beta subunit